MAKEKCTGGRPRKFKTVEEMQKAIDAYFAKCDMDKEPYTITGLAIALDFNSRKSLLDYEGYTDENDKGFLNTIKRAKCKVEDNIEKGLISGKYNATGSIFNLKNNFDWRDKTEVENSGESKLIISLQGDVADWAK